MSASLLVLAPCRLPTSAAQPGRRQLAAAAAAPRPRRRTSEPLTVAQAVSAPAVAPAELLDKRSESTADAVLQYNRE